MSTFSFAIIGGGSIGTRHARNLRTLGQSKLTIIEPYAPRAAELAAEGFATVTDIEAAFVPEIEVVLVCSPTIDHLAHLKMAVEADKHLFIEKPIAHTLVGVEDIIQQAKAKGLISLVGFNMRFRDGFKRVQAMLAEGKLGKPLAARANASFYLPYYHPNKDYRTRYQAQRALGGGVVLDDIHELDYLMALFGPVKQVYAQVGKLSDLEMDTEDYAGMMLTHTSGVITQVQLDFLQRVYRRTLEITGSEATLTLDHNTGELRLYGPASNQYTIYPQAMNVTVNDMYLDEMTHLIACLVGQATPIADLTIGYQSLQLAMAALDSAQKNEVIHL